MGSASVPPVGSSASLKPPTESFWIASGISRQKQPALRVGVIALRILCQYFRSVVIGIDSEGNEANLFWQPVLELLHVGAHCGTDAGTMGEDEVCHPDLPVQVFACDGTVATFGQAEFGNGAVVGDDSGSRTSRQHQSHRERERSHAGRFVMLIAVAKRRAANATVTPTDSPNPGIPIVDATSLP